MSKYVFLPHGAVYAKALCLSACLSVCLSVCHTTVMYRELETAEWIEVSMGASLGLFHIVL